MSIEWWKYIPGYEGLYMASNWGRIRSLDRYVPHNKGGLRLIKGKTLKPILQNNGYLTVNLIDCNGNRKMVGVHRLVALAWLPNPGNLPTVDHINRDKTDNHIENLRWADMKLQGENRDLIGINSKPVQQYTKDGHFVAEYPSVTEAEKQTGIDHSNISKCCLGVQNHSTAGGFIWRHNG